MTLDKQYELGDLTAGRPPEDFTDQDWQRYFKAMYLNTKQSCDRNMSKRVSGVGIGSQCSAYHGDTQWMKYCDFINDVLKTIRSGAHDYCYFIYQIADLLRFEHEDLRTEYMQGEEYFRVWLDRK